MKYSQQNNFNFKFYMIKTNAIFKNLVVKTNFKNLINLIKTIIITLKNYVLNSDLQIHVKIKIIKLLCM